MRDLMKEFLEKFIDEFGKDFLKIIFGAFSAYEIHAMISKADHRKLT